MQWWRTLKEGLAKTSRRVCAGLGLCAQLSPQSLQELEDALIEADVGVKTASFLIESLRRHAPENPSAFLAEAIENMLIPWQSSSFSASLCDSDSDSDSDTTLASPHAGSVHTVLMIGVNGGGKTTTIGKLGALGCRKGLQVRFVAGDTFRAAAEEQLSVWAQRAHASFTPASKEAAGTAFQGLCDAAEARDNLVFIDTAGRLPNNGALIEELRKVDRVIRKKLGLDAQEVITPSYERILVLDATGGQNSFAQAQIFQKALNVTGVIMTKLDSTSKGGILIRVASELGLPIVALGVGETLDHLLPFHARSYAASLVGLPLTPP